jgi:hypothetical protein
MCRTAGIRAGIHPNSEKKKGAAVRGAEKILKK